MAISWRRWSRDFRLCIIKLNTKVERSTDYMCTTFYGRTLKDNGETEVKENNL